MQESELPDEAKSASIRSIRHVRARRLRRIAAQLGLLGTVVLLGCGVLTIIPMDDLRSGVPTGRLFSAAHPPYFTQEIVFSHDVHSESKCESCHPTGQDLEAVRAGGLPSMARCFECHDGVSAPKACETCHQILRVDRRPPSHDAIFLRRHGKDAEGQLYQCALCHRESTCQGCHSTRMPQSHTLRFLRSTHGRFANHSSTTCSVCHEADFCENCHRQPPPDHTATFRAGGGHKQVARLRTRSCLTCHRFEDNCARCHA